MVERLDRRKRIGLAAGPALFAAAALAPTPESMAAAALAAGAPLYGPQVALGILLWAVAWWVTEPLPLGVATLIVPLSFGLAGLLPWRAMLSSYTDPILWIFAAGFAMAAAFQKWGLSQRVSLRLALAYRGDNPRVAALFVGCLPVFFLTLCGSITASTTIVLPFLSAYLAMLGLEPGSKYAEGSMLALGQAATAGAMLLLISTAPNLVAKATIEEFAPGHDLTFADWFVVGAPLAFIGLLIGWFAVFRIVAPEVARIVVDRAGLQRTAVGLGRMSRGEWASVAVLVCAVALWTGPSVLVAVAGANPALAPAAEAAERLLPEAAPAVLAIFLLHLLRSRGEPLLRFEEFVAGVDWNIVFLFGGGIVLGAGLQASGFASWVAMGFEAATGPAPSAWALFAAAALLGFALTYATSNTAAALVACPIAASLALGAGLNPVPPILAAALASSISSALPSTTPPMALVYGTGFVTIRRMVKVGLVADLLRLAVLISLGPLLVELIA